MYRLLSPTLLCGWHNPSHVLCTFASMYQARIWMKCLFNIVFVCGLFCCSSRHEPFVSGIVIVMAHDRAVEDNLSRFICLPSFISLNFIILKMFLIKWNTIKLWGLVVFLISSIVCCNDDEMTMPRTMRMMMVCIPIVLPYTKFQKYNGRSETW